MRVVKRSLDQLVDARGLKVDGPPQSPGRAKWLVMRGRLITKTDTFERAEGLAISMVKRAKSEDVHVVIGKDVGTLDGSRVYRLNTSYHWMV